jgi:prevent-host-death family protein
MEVKTVDVQEAKIDLEDLIFQVSKGIDIILAQDNVPLARLVPIASSMTPRKAGLHKGTIWTSEDFDEPLPEEFWTGTHEIAA